MKPFRKNVALAIDGGGIKGIIVTRALAILEDYSGKPIHSIFRLTAGTSTGSVISAGIAAGLTAGEMFDLYRTLGEKIFRKSWRTLFWPTTRYRYPIDPLESALRQEIGDLTMGDFWSSDPPTDVVITTFDLFENRTRFIRAGAIRSTPPMRTFTSAMRSRVSSTTFVFTAIFCATRR